MTQVRKPHQPCGGRWAQHCGFWPLWSQGCHRALRPASAATSDVTPSVGVKTPQRGEGGGRCGAGPDIACLLWQLVAFAAAFPHSLKSVRIPVVRFVQNSESIRKHLSKARDGTPRGSRSPPATLPDGQQAGARC